MVFAWTAGQSQEPTHQAFHLIHHSRTRIGLFTHNSCHLTLPSMSEGVESVSKKYPSASKHLINRTCKLCNKVCKNARGVAIHVGKAHRDSHPTVVSPAEGNQEFSSGQSR